MSCHYVVDPEIFWEFLGMLFTYIRLSDSFHSHMSVAIWHTIGVMLSVVCDISYYVI